VNWSGHFFSKFPDKHCSYLADGRREAMTRTLGPMDCIRGIAILELAKKQNWTANATRIGNHLRNFFQEKGIENVRGSGALLWIPTEHSGLKTVRLPMPAGSSTGLQRWMPRLDLSPADLTEIFGEDYRVLAVRTLKRGGITRLYICSICASPRMSSFGEMRCEKCGVDWCRYCHSARKKFHQCPK
jgi:hypothetical protein